MSLDLKKPKAKKQPPTAGQPTLKLHTKPGSSGATSTSAPQPTAKTQHEDPNIERVHFYIRHHERVEMDILVSNMKFKWGITEEQTWSIVYELETKRAVKIYYPNQDKSNATVSALWLK